MIANRPQWQRRSLAIAALGVALALIWTALIWPLVAYSIHHRTWRESALENLARFQAMVDKKAEFEAALANAQQNEMWQRLYGAESASVAAAQLQADGRGLLDPKSAVLESLQPLDSHTESGITRIGVRIAFRTTADQLAVILNRVDTNAKLLWIDELVVASAPYQANDANAELSIRMDVWGFLESREPAS